MSSGLRESLVGLLGVAIGACAPLVLERYRNRRLKLSTEMKLVEKRLASYPLLYPILSRFIKDCNLVLAFRQEEITRIKLEAFLEKINECDAEVSLYFKGRTAKSMRDLQESILALLTDNANKYTFESVKDAAGKARNLEQSLRSDIGIYGLNITSDPQLRSGEWESDLKN
jgi:hypothetical protein